MATYAQFKHVELYKIGHGKNRVPNAPKSSIGEIFSSDSTDSSPVKNGTPARPRIVRDTPTRPRDTHSRLFGKIPSSNVSPMVTDTIRSHIQFGEGAVNGNGTPNGKPVVNGKMSNGHSNGHAEDYSPAPSPTKMSFASTPSRGEMDAGEHFSSVKKHHARNPLTGDGMEQMRRPERRHAHRPEGNPITGAGYAYKSMNGQINTVTTILPEQHNATLRHRVPPGGFSNGLW